MTVRCSYAGCRLHGEHFDPDGKWWFCKGHFTEHLILRRQDTARERRDGRIRRCWWCGDHNYGHLDCHTCAAPSERPHDIPREGTA